MLSAGHNFVWFGAPKNFYPTKKNFYYRMVAPPDNYFDNLIVEEVKINERYEKLGDPINGLFSGLDISVGRLSGPFDKITMA